MNEQNNTGKSLMNVAHYNRRSLLLAAGGAGAALILPPLGGLSPAGAQTFAPSESMRGARGNYQPNAPVVESLGSGFVVSGKVLRAGDGSPLSRVRIQIWAATTLGGEHDPVNHGSVITAADGSYKLSMNPIVPYFGQEHLHMAYDDDAFESVFLRPLVPSTTSTSLNVDFILAPAEAS
ncbi:twin-arginine translocation pathway signal [Agrobacterium pusense]|uniref:twin-arginine translocation pathway signal n=1 Tax=Agrobacterium pusense TaxID=648995 RepID=UPI001CB78468|nr:twin-arginine translocation pathway signal [Agrobacterium pusense]